MRPTLCDITRFRQLQERVLALYDACAEIEVDEGAHDSLRAVAQGMAFTLSLWESSLRTDIEEADSLRKYGSLERVHEVHRQRYSRFSPQRGRR